METHAVAAVLVTEVDDGEALTDDGTPLVIDALAGLGNAFCCQRRRQPDNEYFDNHISL